MIWDHKGHEESCSWAGLDFSIKVGFRVLLESMILLSTSSDRSVRAGESGEVPRGADLWGWTDRGEGRHPCPLGSHETRTSE